MVYSIPGLGMHERVSDNVKIEGLFPDKLSTEQFICKFTDKNNYLNSLFNYFLVITYVVGTPKNRLVETFF